LHARTHARTEPLAYSLIVTLTALTLAAPAALAQINGPVPAGTYHLFSVAGVINAGNLGSYFNCTSTNNDPQTVTVEAFDSVGALSGSASLVIGAGASVRFGTKNAAGLLVDSNLVSGGISTGSARILSTGKKLLCHAFVTDSTAATPTLTSLTIVAKLKQKASN
jgi:hypothetical protein